MVYDYAGRLQHEVKPKHYGDNAVKTEYTYDQMDRVKEIKDGFVTAAYEYDKEGRVTFEQDGQGYIKGYGVRTTYYPNGQVARVTDGRGYSTKFTYDGMGRLIKSIAPDGGVTVYTINDNGDIEKVEKKESDSDSAKLVTINGYDKAGNLIESKDSNGNITTYAYNGFGQVRTIQYPSDASIEGLTENFKYDRLGRLVEKNDSMAKKKLKYTMN